MSELYIKQNWYDVVINTAYKPTWHIDTEWTWLNSGSDYWRPKPAKRLSPPEDKIDNKTLSEII